jgi:hypothetical protein
MDELFETYVKLWRRAESGGASVQYYTWVHFAPPRLKADPTGASGWFRSNVETEHEGSQPTIEIYRLECGDEIWTPCRTRGPEGVNLPAPDIGAELITLAHEYGHFRSFRGARAEWELYNAAAERRGQIMSRVDKATHDLGARERDGRMRQAVLAGLDDDARDRVIREESSAWRTGREVLVEFGWVDFALYDDRERRGLHAHRYRLGIDPPWPGDEEEAGRVD